MPTIPENIKSVLSRLEGAGYEAYLVGGCVRDALLGRAVSDYDVTTSASPAEVERVFSGERVIETGIKHGTVTVLSEGCPVEITTFRTDGEYLDSRHPESVTFTPDIEEDLARRDFTVNSVAMDLRGKTVDPFGGREDLEKRVIRCTGEPERRFGEDALRIIRALRFASVLGFDIDRATSDAIHKLRENLLGISAERVFAELKKLLCGEKVFHILTEYSDVICTVIPELSPAVGLEHKSRYHCYDVYTHIAKSVEAAEPDPTLRLIMLFHDIGKPYVFTEDGDVRHFKGHAEVSARIAKERLTSLRADGGTIRLAELLCRVHDRPLVPEKKAVRRLFLKFSYDEIILLCKISKADSEAHAPEYRDRGATADRVMEIADEIKREGECVSLKDLAVDGYDMMALGKRGAEIKEALNEVLSLVIDEKMPNEKDAIIAYFTKK